MASFRCLAAATVISSRSLTLAWPVNSEKSEGRNVISNAASGCVNTSETFRSAMLAEDGARAQGSQGKSLSELAACLCAATLSLFETLESGRAMAPQLKRFLLQWIIGTLAVLVASHVVKGIHYDTRPSLLVATLLLGILNTFVRPLLTLLSLPLVIVTLGLFRLVINACLLMLVNRL